MKNKESITFLITGGGELKDKLLELASNLNVKIIITDFISKQDELFKYYFVADVLVLPSIDEPWGLVVNEAMNAGLPVLVSKVCGCSLDLVEEGVNGYTFDPYNINELKEKLESILFDMNNINMGESSKKIISNWTFENSKKSFEKILNEIK